jgi:hypothetical protein
MTGPVRAEPVYRPIQVRFDHTREIWDQVVVHARVPLIVEDEDAQHFVVEYPSRAQCDRELARLAGLVAYTELSNDSSPEAT